MIIINNSFSINTYNDCNGCTYKNNDITGSLINIGKNYCMFTMNKMNLAFRNSIV